MPQRVNVIGQGPVEFPDSMSEEEILQVLQRDFPAPEQKQQPLPETSATGAALRQGGKAILPALSGAAGWAGAAALAPETGALSFLIPAGAALVSSLLASKAQEKAGKALIPGYAETEAADITKHPIPSALGGLAGAATTFEVAPFQAARGIAQIPKVLMGTASAAESNLAKVAALQAGMGAAGGIASPLLSGEKPTARGVAESAAETLLFGKPRWKALLPASMREAATTVKEGAPDALEPEAAQPVRDMRAQPKPVQRPLPTKEGGEATDVGGSPETPEERQARVLLEAGATAPPKRAQLRITRNPTGEGFVMSGTDINGEPVTELHSTLDEAKDSLTDYMAEKPKSSQHEEQAIAEAERQGTKAVVTDESPTDPNQPFAESGEIFPMQSQPDGTIKIFRKDFNDWINGIPEENRSASIAARIGEEQNHAAVRRTVGAEGAARFWNLLTKWEQTLHHKRYTGRTQEELAAAGTVLSPAQLGYEALNSFQKRAQRLPLGEFVEAMRRERVNVKTLDALANILFKTRQALGTKASREQTQILDNVLNKVQHAIAVLGSGGGEDPFAMRVKKSATKEERSKFLEGRIARLQSQVDLAALRKDPEAERIWSDRVAEAKRQLDQEDPFAMERRGEDFKRRKITEGGKNIQDIPYRFQNAPPVSKWEVPKEVLPSAKDYFGYQSNNAELPMKSALAGILRRFNHGEWSGTWGDVRRALLKLASEPQDNWPKLIGETGATELRHYFNSVRGTENSRESLLEKMRGYVGSFRDVREAMRGPSQNAFDAVINERIKEEGEQSFPMAMRRKKGPPDLGTEDMFKGVPLTVLKGAEPVAPEMRDIPRPELTGPAVAKETMSYLSSTPAPKFEEFVDHMRGKYGPAAKPGFLQEAWIGSEGDPQRNIPPSGVWGFLMNAPGSVLEKLRAELRLGRQVGQTKEISDAALNQMREKYGLQEQPQLPASQAGIPVPEPTRPKTNEQIIKEMFGEAIDIPSLSLAQKLRVKDELPKIRGRENYRNRVVSLIAQRLIGDALEKSLGKPVSRSELTSDDIGWWRGSPHRVWQDVPPIYATDPEAVGRILTENSRTNAKTEVSVSKQVTAWFDKETSQVHLTSSYLDPRRGAVTTSPLAPSAMRPAVEINERLLSRFQPFLTALLDEPVKNFHQRFKSMAEFNEKIGTEARRLRDHETSREAAYREAAGSESLAGVRGEGGSFTGPEADVVRSELGLGKGEVFAERPRTQRAKITDAEAGVVFDVGGTVKGALESPQSVEQLLVNMSDAAAQGKGNWQLISGFQKIYDSIVTKNPKATPHQALEKLYAEIANQSKLAEGDREKFVASIQKAHGQGAEDVPKSEEQKRVADVLRRVSEGPEATAARRLAASPPTQRYEPGTLVEPGTLPPDEPAKTETEKAQEAIAARKGPEVRQQAFPVLPTGPSEVGGAKFNPRPLKESEIQKMAHERPLPEGRKRPAFVLPKRTVKVPGKTRTVEMMGKRVAYTTEPAERPMLGPLESPYTMKRSKGQETYDYYKGRLGAMIAGRKVSQHLYDTIVGADNHGKREALMAGNHIRVQSTNPVVREAAIAMNAIAKVSKEGEVTFPKNFITKLIKRADLGIYRAEEKMRTGTFRERQIAPRWKAAAERLKRAAEYARDHVNDKDLQDTVVALRNEMDKALKFENEHGIGTTERKNYLSGYYEGDFWDGDTVRFSRKILGSHFGKQKTFENYFDAIAEGAYIPASYDIADIAQTRIARGQYLVSRRLWVESAKNVNVPGTKHPIATEPRVFTTDHVDPETGITYKKVDGFGAPKLVDKDTGIETIYELVAPYPNSRPIAVHPRFASVFRNALGYSALRNSPTTKGALWAGQLMKHSVILIMDTFHLGRLGMYGYAGMTREGYKNQGMNIFRAGLTALQWRAEDLPMAVKQGLVRKEDAAWAMEELPKNSQFKIRLPGTGKFEEIKTNHDLSGYLVRNGLNATGTVDALWKDAVRHLPGIGENWHKVVGPLNRLLFDKLTPGLMMQGAVMNFRKFRANNPDIHPAVLANDVIRDTNAIYGNMGMTGIFKNPTFRDMAQLVLLAPMWQEGLLRKELGLVGRVASLPLRAAGKAGIVPRGTIPREGLPAMGMLGETMAKGLLAFFVGTQIVNLMTRHKFTWDNEEKGHGMDAWIPTGDDPDKGVWFSPLSVFAELIHDLIRYGESRKTVWDSIVQIGENKLGPFGRLGMVLLDRKNSRGERLTSTPEVLGEASKNLLVTPITFALPLQAAGRALGIPGVRPVTREQAYQRTFGALGVKVQVVERLESRVGKMADDFMKREGLKKETGWDQVQTTEPSYTKLRSALRMDDTGRALKMLESLRKTHTDKEIIMAMKIWERRPFTGNKNAERLFLHSLAQEQRDDYGRALDSRLDTMNKFIDLMVRN